MEYFGTVVADGFAFAGKKQIVADDFAFALKKKQVVADDFAKKHGRRDDDFAARLRAGILRENNNWKNSQKFSSDVFAQYGSSRRRRLCCPTLVLVILGVPAQLAGGKTGSICPSATTCKIAK